MGSNSLCIVSADITKNGALGLGSGELQHFQMSSTAYPLVDTVVTPPWRARLGFVDDRVEYEQGYLALGDEGYLQVGGRGRGGGSEGGYRQVGGEG